jgi:hypothetical protein
LARAIQSNRGMAVANNLIGLAFDQLHQADSAILFQERAIELALEKKRNRCGADSHGCDGPDCMESIG